MTNKFLQSKPKCGKMRLSKFKWILPDWLKMWRDIFEPISLRGKFKAKPVGEEFLRVKNTKFSLVLH